MLAERDKALDRVIDILVDYGSMPIIKSTVLRVRGNRSSNRDPSEHWVFSAIGRILTNYCHNGEPIGGEILSRLSDQQARLLLHHKTEISFFHTALIYYITHILSNIDIDSYRKIMEDPGKKLGNNIADFLCLDGLISDYNEQDWGEVDSKIEHLDEDYLFALVRKLDMGVEEEVGFCKALHSQYVVGMMIEDAYTLCNGNNPPRKTSMVCPYVASDIQLGGNNGLLKAFAPDHSLVI